MATIVAAEQWPEILRRERVLSWRPDFGNEAGPPALDGSRQYRNSNGGGLWRASLQAVQLRRREHVLAWLGTEVLLRGGMTPVNVPLMFYSLTPRMDVATTVITAVGAMAARAVSGRVDLEHAGTLSAGMHFSAYDVTTYGWRLHRLSSVAAVGGQPTQRDIAFWPPLRFAVADNYAFEWDNPRCVMRLAASDVMDVELEQRKRGDPSAEFEEAY